MHLLLLMKDIRRSLSPDPQVDDLVQAGILTPAANPGGVTALLAVRPVEGGGDTTRALADLREDRV
jgi:hypothetical protein